MKKIIAVVLALVLLVTGGAAGFVYANNDSHEPMTGQKLVGSGPLTSRLESDGTYLAYWTRFHFLNPDCISEITIERISIIKSDGTLIYEGPLLHADHTLWTEPMKPHERRFIVLHQYMRDEEGGWLTPQDARRLRRMVASVEIFWTSTDKEGLPLIGWAWIYQGTIDEDGFQTAITNYSSNQMVNMEQKLKPKDKD